MLCTLACVVLGGCSFVRLDAVKASIVEGGASADEYQIGTIVRSSPIVEAMIDGRGPYRLILDTGAGVSALKPEIVQELHLRKSGKASMNDIHGKASGFDIYLANSVRLNAVELSGVPIITSPGLSTLFENMQLDGLLGYYGLDKFTLDLNYESGKVNVSTQRLDRDAPGVTKMVKRRDATPVINITHTLPNNDGTFTIPYGIDSGGGGFMLSLSRTSRSKLVDLSRVRRVGGGQGLNSTSDSQLAPLNGSVEFASFEMMRVPVNLEHSHTLIGAGLLSQFRVQIDPQSRLVQFTKHGTADRTGFVLEIYGVGVLKALNDDDSVVLERIGDQTPAMLAGLRPGDRVIEIDDQPVTDPEVASKLGWNADKPTTLKLLVVRDGERFEVEIGMEPLFPDDLDQRGDDLELPMLDLTNGTIKLFKDTDEADAPAALPGR